MIEIIPAILTTDVSEVREKIYQTLDAGLARVQIDIIDGHFAANRTLSPDAIEEIEAPIKIDFHLMTKEPIGWIERSIRGHGDRLIGQIEQMSDQRAFVEKVLEYGLYAGLALDVATPVSSLDLTIVSSLDVVLVMSVPAGFGGQEFDTRALGKIEELKALRAKDNLSFKICDDGGLTLDKVDDVAREGVDEVAIGKRLFAGNLRENIDKFLTASTSQ